MRIRIAAVILATIAGLGLSACGHSTSSGPSLTAKTECASQYVKWHSSPSYQNIKALQNSVPAMMTAARNHQQGEVNKDAKKVEAATVVVSKNLPPKCIPGVDSNIQSAMGAINTAAVAATKKDYPTAKMNGKSAISSIDAALKALVAYAK